MAAANAAARAAVASRAAYEAHLNQDDYTSDPLSSLAAAAAAESESDAELARSPEQVKPLHTNRLQVISTPALVVLLLSLKDQH